jgi:cell division protein FtsB
MATAAARRTNSRRTAPRRRAGGVIRWDRVGRFALLAVLCGILALYVTPIMRWRTQSATADAQRAEVHRLQQEQLKLQAGVAALDSPSALDEQARALGMVKRGEVPLVVEGLPGSDPEP